MAQTYTDQFYALDPGSPPSAGTAVSVLKADLVDVDADAQIEGSTGDMVNGQVVANSWPGDTVTIARADGSEITYTGITFYLDGGGRLFTPTDGQILEPGTFVRSTFVLTYGPLDVDRLGAPCFTPGTMVDAPCGLMAVDDLAEGDLINTADDGPVPVAAVVRRHLPCGHLADHPRQRPIRIMAGALAPGVPRRDLVVSPQHRVLLRSPVIGRMFGTPEVLAPAVHLLGLPGVERADVSEVTYIHVVTARHHVIRAEGCDTETLLLGPLAQAQFGREAYAHLVDTLAPLGALPYVSARPLARGARVRQAVWRHMRNGKPLVFAPAAPRLHEAAARHSPALICMA